MTERPHPGLGCGCNGDDPDCECACHDPRERCTSCVDNEADGPDGYCSTCRVDTAAHSPIYD